jgi:hypothetical protein
MNERENQWVAYVASQRKFFFELFILQNVLNNLICSAYEPFIIVCLGVFTIRQVT